MSPLYENLYTLLWKGHSQWPMQSCNGFSMPRNTIEGSKVLIFLLIKLMFAYKGWPRILPLCNVFLWEWWKANKQKMTSFYLKIKMHFTLSCQPWEQIVGWLWLHTVAHFLFLCATVSTVLYCRYGVECSLKEQKSGLFCGSYFGT